MTTITIDRAVVEQALDFIVATNKSSQFWLVPESNLNKAVTALRSALAQQDEPVQVAERERVASQWDGCVTHQLDTFGPVDIGASIRAGELVEAQQAEPLNLADPAVQKRLATQWGYVPAAQAEPVEPAATLIAQRDALLEALKLARSVIGHPDDAHTQMIDATIKAVEGTK